MWGTVPPASSRLVEVVENGGRYVVFWSRFRRARHFRRPTPKTPVPSRVKLAGSGTAEGDSERSWNPSIPESSGEVKVIT
jgi:hypothetical protein